MTIQHYLYTFFVFLLVCIVVMLCNYFFSDAKRQKRWIEERERKILKLYQSLEDVMDEFQDFVTLSKDELSESIAETKAEANRLLAAKAVAKKPASLPKEPDTSTLEKGDAAMPGEPQPARSQPEPRETDTAPKPKAAASARKTPAAQKHETILALSNEGKDRIQIAKELLITVNEVDLVLGLSKK